MGLCLLYRMGLDDSTTVEQEISVTGNFREFLPQAIHMQETGSALK